MAIYSRWIFTIQLGYKIVITIHCFLKDFFKLMNSDVLGNMQENLRNHAGCQTGFLQGNPITDCLTVTQCRVATLKLNGPIYMGFSMFVLSKLHMYDFHYNHMCVKYPRADQLRLLFTDTDSLAYAVQSDDIYRDMADDAEYDFREYPLHQPLYDASNRKALRFFEDELNSVPV